MKSGELIRKRLIYVRIVWHAVHVCSGINGVKEMEGFRRTFNISYSPGDHVNQTEQCGSEDDVETSALIVQNE